MREPSKLEVDQAERHLDGRDWLAECERPACRDCSHRGDWIAVGFAPVVHQASGAVKHLFAGHVLTSAGI